MKRNRPVCPNCNGVNIYVRKDKSFVCRRCGYDTRWGELPFPQQNRPVCPSCGSGNAYVRKDRVLECRCCGYLCFDVVETIPELFIMSVIERQKIKEKGDRKEPPKEPRGYYLLLGRYMFRNDKTWEYASVTSYSKATKTKYTYESPDYLNLREQAIDYAKARLVEITWEHRWLPVAIGFEEWLYF